MSKKIRHAPVALDSQGITDLPSEDVAIILRGADEIIMQGGRSLLAKILKGSKEKKLQELKLNQVVPFGALSKFSLKEIHARIDWLILNDYLAIEYAHSLPMLVFTARGWEIEKQTLAAEYQSEMDKHIVSNGSGHDLSWLNECHREVIICLLDRIRSTGNQQYIPQLESWSKNAVKKVRRLINDVIDDLRNEQVRSECVSVESQ